MGIESLIQPLGKLEFDLKETMWYNVEKRGI